MVQSAYPGRLRSVVCPFRPFSWVAMAIQFDDMSGSSERKTWVRGLGHGRAISVLDQGIGRRQPGRANPGTRRSSTGSRPEEHRLPSSARRDEGGGGSSRRSESIRSAPRGRQGPMGGTRGRRLGGRWKPASESRPGGCGGDRRRRTGGRRSP